MKRRQKLLMKTWWKTGLAPLSDHLYPQPPKRQTSLNVIKPWCDRLSDAWTNQRQRNGKRDPDHKCIVFTSLTVLRSFHHFFATHPIICYDNKHCFPQSGVATGRYAGSRRLHLQHHRICPSWPALWHCAKFSHANRSGRHYVDHLRMGSSANVIAFMLMTSQVERRKLLICLFVVFIASHVLSFCRGALPFWWSVALVWLLHMRFSGRLRRLWRSVWLRPESERRHWV